jgi:hypothetical protein
MTKLRKKTWIEATVVVRKGAPSRQNNSFASREKARESTRFAARPILRDFAMMNGGELAVTAGPSEIDGECKLVL